MQTKHFLLIAFLFLSFSIQAQKNTVTTYYLIRHAEKVKSENPDPVLHAEGITRSEKWAEIFSDILFDAIYSTEFTRTWETVKPTAEKQGLDIILYDPVLIDYKKFKKETRGKTVLIVGHSNTIPVFVNKLIGKEKYKIIEEGNNGNLYIVETVNKITSDQVLHLN